MVETTKTQQAKKLFRKLADTASRMFIIRHKTTKEPGYMIKKLSEEEREILSHLKSDDIKDDNLKDITNDTFWEIK